MDVLLPAILFSKMRRKKFSKNVLGGTAALHTCRCGGGNFFRLFFDPLAHSPWLSDVINFRAKSPRAKLKAEMVATLIVNPEALRPRFMSGKPNFYSKVKCISWPHY